MRNRYAASGGCVHVPFPNTDLRQQAPKTGGKDTPRDEPKCVWCGQVLDYDSMPELEAQQRELRDAVLRLAGENPDVFQDVRRTRDLVTVLDDNPDLYEDVQGFVEALSDG